MSIIFTIIYLPTGESIGNVQGEYCAKYVVRKLGADYKYFPLIPTDPDVLIKIAERLS